jgi:hypothetical protein
MEIEEFLKAQQGSTITERLNAVYSGMPTKVEPALERAILLSGHDSPSVSRLPSGPDFLLVKEHHDPFLFLQNL